ncbi:MAG TPA: DNRLRE domain-containing protein [Planctomycetota bacterium]|nr:DNRLRE domain-containing protein [Planctomycetota bacterium]
MYRTLFAAVMFAGFSAAQIAVQITADHDNTLYQDAAGSTSNGSGEFLFCGLSGTPTTRRTVLHFPLTAVPAGSRIVAASVQMFVSRSGVFVDFDIEAHRLLADWGEGTSNAISQEGRGAAATTGDATWLHRFYPTLFWNRPGGDFDPIPSVTVPSPQSGPFTFTTSRRMVADVQDWLDGRAPNFGWLLKTDEQLATEVRRFNSRESLNVPSRPTLTVTFVPPGSVVSVGLGCIGSNGLSLHLQPSGAPVQGQTFSVQLQNGLPGAVAANLLSFGLSAEPLDLAPGCTYFLEFLPGIYTPGIHILDGSGQASETYPVPVLAALFGMPLAMQAASLDAVVPPIGVVLSNALLLVVQ